MSKSAAILVAILVSSTILIACSSGPSEEEVAASVEAQLSSMQAPTATLPATNTPKPTVDWHEALGGSSPTSYFDEHYNEFAEETAFFPINVPSRMIESRLDLIVVIEDGGAPLLVWRPFYTGDDWLFMESVRARVAGTTYDIGRFDSTDVYTNIYDDGDVDETTTFPLGGDDIEMLESLYKSNEGTIRLDGSKGHIDISITEDTMRLWFAALALFQDLGGEF